MKILVVEDNEISRRIIMEFLSKSEHIIRFIADGAEALENWLEFQPHVLITNIVLPGLGGIDLIKKIRSIETRSFTFIIVLTSALNVEMTQECFIAGADELLSKPVSENELKVRLLVAERLSHHEEQKVLIFALGQLLEARDDVTGFHVEKVGIYCRLLSQFLSRTPQYSSIINHAFIDEIEIASALHDIGKIGISDTILKKPNLFTPEERIIMQEHTLIGYRLIQNIRANYPQIDFLTMASDVVLSHHEHYDGQRVSKWAKRQ